LNLCKKRKLFVIQDFITGKELFEVPKDIMKYTKKGGVDKVINRFKFVDNSSFKIMSEEGVEELIDFKKGFSDISFNKIPLYAGCNKKSNFRHYFLKPNPQ
jgi:hypothetical protein